MIVKRDEVLIYFNYRGDTSNCIKNLGATIQYLNKKLGYAVLYVDDDKLKKITDALKKMKGFKKLEVSPIDLAEINV